MVENIKTDTSIDGMINLVFSKCSSWLGKDADGNVILVDPHEREAVGHHYALSHFAAAAILGNCPSSKRFEEGLAVLRGVLRRWERDSAIPGFHNDFNHFALVLMHDELERLGLCEEERGAIRRTVMSTADSNHDTVNWLPMRMIADEARLRWGGRGSRALELCRRKISRAANGDGFIEDRLPRGTSFNLQYDVSSVALLDFLESCGIDQPVGLDGAYSALAACVLPDGDINYLGRGCNQIFAWGPWIYLLKRRGEPAALELSLRYLACHLPNTLENDNLLLNDLSGADRQLWWDYHYCSVYTAHLLLWLVLARRAEPVSPVSPSGLTSFSDTGLEVVRSEHAMAVTFSGRREYLAERGPEVTAIWTLRHGVIHKGSFGPWLKAFGFKHAFPSVLLNHFGLLRVGGRSVTLPYPLFVPVSAHILGGRLVIEYKLPRRLSCCLNLPIHLGVDPGDITAYADNRPVDLMGAGGVITQYGFENILQTAPYEVDEWRVEIIL